MFSLWPRELFDGADFPIYAGRIPLVGFPVVGRHDCFEASSFLPVSLPRAVEGKPVCLGVDGGVKMLPLVTLSNQRGKPLEHRWFHVFPRFAVMKN